LLRVPERVTRVAPREVLQMKSKPVVVERTRLPIKPFTHWEKVLITEEARLQRQLAVVQAKLGTKKRTRHTRAK
jgi:hypothetical protein